MATIKIPGIGPVEKKWVYIGGAAILGVVGYAYWVSRNANASEVSDYTTGEVDYAMDSGVDEYKNPGGSQPPVEQDYLTAPQTNAEWGQKATSVLIDLGNDPLAASTAVGRYLLRQTLSAAQADMIRTAVGQLGPPPTGTFPIDTTPTPEPDKAPGAVSGLRVTDVWSDKLRVSWTKTPGATGYLLYKSGQSSATSHALDTDAYIYFLKPNTSYTISIEAVGPGMVRGPRTSVSTKTKKK